MSDFDWENEARRLWRVLEARDEYIRRQDKQIAEMGKVIKRRLPSHPYGQGVLLGAPHRKAKIDRETLNRVIEIAEQRRKLGQ